MVKKTFSTSWKSSVQPRKQRKYRHNAPLHILQKFAHAHLSKELRTKLGTRSVQVKKGYKVKIVRGQFKKREGKIERVSLRYQKIYISGIEVIKKDGTKLLAPIDPSNLIIVEAAEKIAKVEKKK